MISDIGALFYLEYRQFVNRIRRTLHEPGRALVYLLAIGYFIAITATRSRGYRVMPTQVAPEPYASALMFTYVALLGVMAYGAASGIVGSFSSASDARFLTGSAISERLVVVWLQLRRSRNSIARMLFTVVVYALVFSSSGTVLGISLATLGGTLAATGIAVPMLKLRSIAGARPAQGLAGVLAVLGIAPMIVLLASVVNPTRASALIESIGAGYAFNRLFNGDPLALAALYAFGAATIAVAYVAGTNIYPDLYAASMRVLEFREKQKRGAGAVFTMERTFEKRAVKWPGRRLFDRMAGPWTIAWKEWIAFERSPSMQRTFWLGAGGSTLFGAIFGAASDSNNGAIESLSLAGTIANMIVIFIAMGSAVALATDLQKPLWWIGRDSLWMRLFAWMVGTSWRMALCICAGVVAWSFAIRLPQLALAGVPIVLAGVLYLKAVGLALYALFPSTIDQRGPLAMIRVLLTYLLAAPPAVAGIVTGVLSHMTPVGVAACVAVGAVETLALTSFAAARIAGRGIAFAQAETM